MGGFRAHPKPAAPAHLRTRRYARGVAEPASQTTVDRVKQGYEFWNRWIAAPADLYATFRAVDDKIVRSQLFPSVEAAMEVATGSVARNG